MDARVVGLGRPSLEDIRANAVRIAPWVAVTPVHVWRGREIAERLGPDTEVVLKLELFQHTGTFKARGALTTMLRLSAGERARGVTTVSAGNHAIAVAYAASILGVSAKVVMLSTASPARVAAAQAHGAEIVIVDGGPPAFAEAERIAREEGRIHIHPFEGEAITLGTATLGLEFSEQAGPLDDLIVAIGGGGLMSGVATAFKQLQPACRIYGVEPEGADSMHRSFAAGSPQAIERVGTIANSLGPPSALPYSYGLCSAYVDELAMVDDQEICEATALLFREMKLAVEPAAAAAVAALVGPLREQVRGRRVGVVLCGTNTDIDSFSSEVRRGQGR